MAALESSTPASKARHHQPISKRPTHRIDTTAFFGKALLLVIVDRQNSLFHTLSLASRLLMRNPGRALENSEDREPGNYCC